MSLTLKIENPGLVPTPPVGQVSIFAFQDGKNLKIGVKDATGTVTHFHNDILSILKSAELAGMQEEDIINLWRFVKVNAVHES